MSKVPQSASKPTLDEVLGTWLGPTAAAKEAGVCVRTMHYLVSSGRMRSITTPIGQLIEPTQLVAYAKEHRRRFQIDGYLTRGEQIKAKIVRQIEEELVREHQSNAAPGEVVPRPL